VPGVSAPRSDDLLALGAAVREARRRTGMSQERLALEAGLDRAFVSALERGQRNVTFDNLIKVCRALGARPSGLFGRWEQLVAWKDK
jgi:transcriptional regulator with XRE-family HTH domain